MELRKGYKQTEIGVIPEDWNLQKLGDFSNVSSGGTPNRKIASYWEGNIPWITTSQIDFNIIDCANEFITEDGLNNSAAKMYKTDTLLMAMYGQGKTRGKVAILGIDAATNQACAAITLDKKVLKEFVFYNLSGRYDEIRSLSNNGNQENLNGDLIKKICLPLPPTITEQTAIATALSDTDALITSIEKLIAKKRNIKQGAMQKLLQPKEGWENKSLPEICWFQEGPGVRNSQFTTSGVKLFNGTNIEDGKLLLEKTARYISEKEAYGWYSHFLVDDGDILIACSGVTIDKFQEKVTIASRVHLPLCMNTSTMRFKIVSNELLKDFLFHFLKSKSFKEQIGGKATGSAQLNFGPSHVNMVNIALPSIQEQINIATILSDMDAEIAALETKLEKYRNIKLGMMQNLLTGKIRLIMIEEKINGINYKLPSQLSDFQKNMYVHLINWKWKNITKEPGNYKRKDKKGEIITYEYDAILPESVHDKYPVIYPEILSQLIDHKKNFEFKLHEHFNHMASSQAANVNLFLPILFSPKANDILKELKPDFERIATEQLDHGFRIEFWDGNSNTDKGILGDHSAIAGTDSDIAIAYYNKENELCLWLIEHKLTEKEFTECGGAKSKGKKQNHDCTKSFSDILKNKDLCYYHSGSEYEYWNITETNQAYFVNHDKFKTCPFKGGMNQLWRNQLLGLALEKESKYKNVYFSVVHHPDNDSLNQSINNYRELINNNPKFSVFTSKKVIDVASKISDSNLQTWIDWYKELYKL